MTNIEENELIRRIVSGEKNLYENLIKEYQNKIFSAMFSWVGNYDDALDLTQDVFMYAYKALPKFRGEASFYTWVMRIAINRKNSHFKKKLKRKSNVSIEDLEALTDYQFELHDDRQNVENDAVQEDLKTKTYEEMMNLPEKYREFIVLRDIEECTYEEIAEIKGISMANVKTRIHRARKMLLNRLYRRGLL